MIPTLKCEKQKQTYPHKHIPPKKKKKKFPYQKEKAKEKHQTYIFLDHIPYENFIMYTFTRRITN